LPRAALGTLALIALLFAAVLADNANLLFQRASEGPTTSLLRPYGNLERYALKPIELLLPIREGAIVPWRTAGASYLRQALVRGEMGPVYLGLAGVVALPDGLLFIHDLDAFLSPDEERRLSEALGGAGA